MLADNAEAAERHKSAEKERHTAEQAELQTAQEAHEAVSRHSNCTSRAFPIVSLR